MGCPRQASLSLVKEAIKGETLYIRNFSRLSYLGGFKMGKSSLLGTYASSLDDLSLLGLGFLWHFSCWNGVIKLNVNGSSFFSFILPFACSPTHSSPLT